MIAFSHLSVRQKLIRLILLASALALLCVFMAATLYEVRTFRPRALAQLEAEAEVLEEVLAAPLDFGLRESAKKGLAKHCGDRAIVVAALYDNTSLFAAYEREGVSLSLPSAPAKQSGHRFEARQLSLWWPVRGTENAVIGYLYLVRELPPPHARLPQYAIMTGTVLLALAVVGFVLMRALRHNILRPLAALVETTTRVIRDNDYGARADIHSRDELGQLATAFNQMLETVGERDAALRQANTRIQSVFNSATEILIVATDVHGLVTVFSTGAERMLGYTAAEVVGKLTPLLWHHEGETRARAAELTRQLGRPIEGSETLSALARQGQPDAREWTYVRKDRTELKVHLAVTAVHDARGTLTGFLGVASDITERRRAEEQNRALQSQLLQAQKMEAVGQLAGGVAHDFNNILTAVLMQLSLLRGEKGLSVEVREGLTDIEMEAKRAANLTRQLLLFSRRQVLQTQAFDLNSLLGNLLKMLRRLIGEQIVLELSGAPTEVWIEADPGTIEQVVMNLAVNARDAMPKGGRITLSVQSLEVDASSCTRNPEARPGHFACLTVADTGCGMDEATQRRVFEPFFTTKEAGKGTGLGLATVYGIVKQHKGWIEVQSALGQGTTFRVHLPACRAPSLKEPTSHRPQTGPRGHETILLVEDAETVRRATASTLRQLGYRVIEAGNGHEALDLWPRERTQVSLVLTDMVMPGDLSGQELIQRLRRDKPSLKCLLASGYSHELVQDGLSPQSHTVFLAKPLDPNALAEKIRSCLDGR